MFARKVFMQLKPNTAKNFTAKLDSDVIPLLRKQNGFQDEIALLAKDGRSAIGISIWDRRESAEVYERGTYSQVQKMLDSVIEGTPRVETFDVSNCTFHPAHS